MEKTNIKMKKYENGDVEWYYENNTIPFYTKKGSIKDKLKYIGINILYTLIGSVMFALPFFVAMLQGKL